MQSDSTIKLDHFQTLNIIGEGEFGTVYLIENKETKNKYAAKVIKTKCSRNPEKKAFKKEIVTYSKLKHPTILPLFGYNSHNFESKNYPTILTEYASNGSLQRFIQKVQNGQPPSELTDTKRYIILLGTALGMYYLHTKGIAHKDLKPSNILLDDNFYPHLSDFILTKYTDKELSKYFMKKTIENYFYVAPEINVNKPYTFKADVYSFATIAYELITYNKRSPIEISEIPGEVNQKFFKQCLSKEPTDRPLFSEISKFLISKNFTSLFPNLDQNEVTSYLDSFEEDPQVMFLHGAFLDDNRSDKSECVRYYKKSAELGNARAMNNYACMLKHGVGVGMDKSAAASLFKMSAEKGNTRAMYNYALMLEHGDGITMDKSLAATYYKMSADKGNADAMYNYGHMLEHGDGVSANVKEAVKYYRMAIYKGNDDAMNNYALLLKHGQFIPQNTEATVYYYKLSINRGNTDAMYNYALMLENGDCVPMNKQKAATLYKLAAHKGNDNAMYNYACMLDTGDGIKQNKKDAAHFYALAIERGNMFAMNNYARMLERGDGIQMNKKEAAHLYRLAADKGNAVAMNNYARMLHDGVGVEQNKKEAARFYRLAIEKGNNNAMFNYAKMLENGDGVDADRKSAAYYYRMAADCGNSNAMRKFASLIDSGVEVPLNKEEADRKYKL